MPKMLLKSPLATLLAIVAAVLAVSGAALQLWTLSALSVLAFAVGLWAEGRARDEEARLARSANEET